MDDQEHYCDSIETFPSGKFIQSGKGKGESILILGEAPAPNGWRKSGRAFYTVEGKLLPTGRNLNKLLLNFNLSVEKCGFTELVKCYPGKDRKLLNECGTKCWPIFLKQLQNVDYKLIIILGVKTLEIFNKLINKNLKIGELIKVDINGGKYNILPIYHPSPIAPFNYSRNVEIFNRLDSQIRSLT